jgi:CubicO group peptidase (beta-lactamase class C family)
VFADADAAIAAGLGSRYSAAIVRVERAGQLVHERAFGTTVHGGGDSAKVDTRFDLASLTKVFASTLALRLVADGVLALDTPLSGIIDEWRGTAHEPITLRDILAHISGIHSGADYRVLLDHNVVEYTLHRPLAERPRTTVIYSDLGFIALLVAVERASGAPFSHVFAEALQPLGLEATSFSPRARERGAIPATERDAWRGLVQGTVHDEKAHLMGGVSAHAGLFGTARDVARVADLYLAASRPGSGFLPESLAREAISEQAADPVLRRGLGWALRTSDENSCGVRISRRAFGHTGFTGTSVWADPERDLTVVFLTNGVHFGRNDLRDVRATVCDRVIEALDR